MADSPLACPSFCNVDAVALVAVTGAEAVDLLHRLCTQDVRPLHAPGARAEALLVSAQGKLLHHVTAWRPDAAADVGPDVLWLATAAHQGAALCAHLERYTIVEEVAYAVLGEAVPCATLVWEARQHAAVLPDLARTLQLGGGANPRLTVLPAPAALGPAAWVLGDVTRSQADFVGHDLPHLPAALTENEHAPTWPLVPSSPEAFRYLRLRAGLPALGEDYEAGGMPLEARLGPRTVSWNKGCYVGQEVLSRLDSYRKVARLTMGVAAPAEAAQVLARHAGPWRLRCDDKPIGRLTSWAEGSGAHPPHPAGNGPHVLGLAVVKTAFAQPGTEVVVHAGDAGDVGAAAETATSSFAATLVDCPAWS